MAIVLMEWLLVLSRLLHIVGLVFGAGGATALFILNKKAGKNPELQKILPSLIKQFSMLIWLGIILLFISGVGLQATIKWQINRNLLVFKHILSVLIVINGVYLAVSAKRLGQLAQAGVKPNDKIIKSRKRAKLIGALNLILWYVVIILSVIL